MMHGKYAMKRLAAFLAAAALGLGLVIVPASAVDPSWDAYDDYIDDHTVYPAKPCIYSAGLGSYESSDVGPVAVQIGTQVPVTWCYYDPARPVPGYNQDYVMDMDQWSDPSDYDDRLQTWWDWSNYWTADPGEIPPSQFVPGYSHTFGELGTATVYCSIRDLSLQGLPPQYHADANDGPARYCDPNLPSCTEWDCTRALTVKVVDDTTPPPQPSVSAFDTISASMLSFTWSSAEDTSSPYDLDAISGNVRYEAWLTDAAGTTVATGPSGRWSAGRHCVTMQDLSLSATTTYRVHVKVYDGVGNVSAEGVSNEAHLLSFSLGNGWAFGPDGKTLQYAGSQYGTGSAQVLFPVAYDTADEASNEYEFTCTVHCFGTRAADQNEWPAPWIELTAPGESACSGKRLFGDDIDRRRRVRFRVTQSGSVSIRFASNAGSTAPATVADYAVRPVDSICRDTTLGVPYTGYNLPTPPGGGIVDGWISGYNDTDMQAWVDTVKDPDKGMLLRVFMVLDQGMANFEDDIWQYHDESTPNPEAQYHNDPPPTSKYGQVVQSGRGYLGGSGQYKGFSQPYCENTQAFLDKCADNGMRVAAVLLWPQYDWRIPRKYVDQQGWVRAKPLRKTTFDKEEDRNYLVYNGTSIQKYHPSATVEHQTMRDSYLVAIRDWLDLFGSHPALWGVDIMNEPYSFLGCDAFYSPTFQYRSWHGLGWPETVDTEYWSNGRHYTHRVREFLADAYDVVESWRQANGREITEPNQDARLWVVGNVDGEQYDCSLNHIDMIHPWNVGEPEEGRVRKVCDVFGLHWYQLYKEPNPDPPLPPNDLYWTHMWSSDRLQPWRHPEEGPASQSLEDPRTDWMAEKPMILAETRRYANDDWFRTFDGDSLFEDALSTICSWTEPAPPGAPLCNWAWYSRYLRQGEQRHIESFIFWRGDGSSSDRHQVQGQSLAPPPYSERDAYGWHAPYSLGPYGGAAIRAYQD